MLVTLIAFTHEGLFLVLKGTVSDDAYKQVSISRHIVIMMLLMYYLKGVIHYQGDLGQAQQDFKQSRSKTWGLSQS
jgi:hypothetical protein